MAGCRHMPLLLRCRSSARCPSHPGLMLLCRPRADSHVSAGVWGVMVSRGAGPNMTDRRQKKGEGPMLAGEGVVAIWTSIDPEVRDQS
jgi:hypothetical protein